MLYTTLHVITIKATQRTAKYSEKKYVKLMIFLFLTNFSVMSLSIQYDSTSDQSLYQSMECKNM